MMQPHSNKTKVYLALGATDMRKSINGLSLLVEDTFGKNLFSESLFAFCNRQQNMVKLLFWDKNGFCVWMKRLEADKFRWPNSKEDVMEIDYTTLTWILSGLDVQHAHKQFHAQSAG